MSDPSLLGLGELGMREAERRQPHGGRLDMLLEDTDTSTRYEVELQLGGTDESHIIRTLEFANGSSSGVCIPERKHPPGSWSR